MLKHTLRLLSLIFISFSISAQNQSVVGNSLNENCLSILDFCPQALTATLDKIVQSSPPFAEGIDLVTNTQNDFQLIDNSNQLNHLISFFSSYPDIIENINLSDNKNAYKTIKGNLIAIFKTEAVHLILENKRAREPQPIIIESEKSDPCSLIHISYCYFSIVKDNVVTTISFSSDFKTVNANQFIDTTKTTKTHNFATQFTFDIYDDLDSLSSIALTFYTITNSSHAAFTSSNQFLSSEGSSILLDIYSDNFESLRAQVVQFKTTLSRYLAPPLN